MKLSRRSWALVAVGVLGAVLLGYFGVVGFMSTSGVSMESRSMSHSDVKDVDGVLDPGERIILTGARNHDEVVTYYEGKATGYEVAGDWGDAILFNPVTEHPGTVRVVHRAIAWVVYNRTADAYDIPEAGVHGSRSFTLEVGTWNPLSQQYEHLHMPVVLHPDFAGRHDGFLTKGDHNFGFDQDYLGGLQDVGRVELVEFHRIDGKVEDWIDRSSSYLLGGIALGGAVLLGAAAVLFGPRVRSLFDRARGPSCPSCRRRVEAGTPFCPACGATVPAPPAPPAPPRGR